MWAGHAEVVGNLNPAVLQSEALPHVGSSEFFGYGHQTSMTRATVEDCVKRVFRYFTVILVCAPHVHFHWFHLTETCIHKKTSCFFWWILHGRYIKNTRSASAIYAIGPSCPRANPRSRMSRMAARSGRAVPLKNNDEKVWCHVEPWTTRPCSICVFSRQGLGVQQHGEGCDGSLCRGIMSDISRQERVFVNFWEVSGSACFSSKEELLPRHLSWRCCTQRTDVLALVMLFCEQLLYKT